VRERREDASEICRKLRFSSRSPAGGTPAAVARTEDQVRGYRGYLERTTASMRRRELPIGRPGADTELRAGAFGSPSISWPRHSIGWRRGVSALSWIVATGAWAARRRRPLRTGRQRRRSHRRGRARGSQRPSGRVRPTERVDQGTGGVGKSAREDEERRAEADPRESRALPVAPLTFSGRCWFRRMKAGERTSSSPMSSRRS
jgi:hypothetical protein